MRTVTATGRGSCRVVPDSAVVRLAAACQGPDVSGAYEALVGRAQRLVEVARRHSDERRIASTGISVWPHHDHEGRRSGFEARHAYAVGCADLPAAGALLAELAEEIGDGLVVDHVGLEVADDSAAVLVARDAAFADARARAAALARRAGLRLGEVQSIVEGGPDTPDDGGGGAMRLATDSGGLQPGETSISASVTVVWSLVDD